MNIAVTGGAGYIGSALVHELVNKGHDVTVIDNFSTGYMKVKGAKIITHDLSKPLEIEADLIFHLAADKDLKTTEEYNLQLTKNIISDAKIIFSSTAAVYGQHNTLVNEDSQKKPFNSYGKSKLACEEYLKKRGNYVILRYFNVEGDVIGYNKKEGLFPKVCNTLSGEPLQIFGKDFDTPDGTAIRDFIHLKDLVYAHILSMNLKDEILNIGTGKGISVQEVVNEFVRVTKKPLPYSYDKRRDGDVMYSVASQTKSLILLKWKPSLGLREMVESSLSAYRTNIVNDD